MRGESSLNLYFPPMCSTQAEEPPERPRGVLVPRIVFLTRRRRAVQARGPQVRRCLADHFCSAEFYICGGDVWRERMEEIVFIPQSLISTCHVLEKHTTCQESLKLNPNKQVCVFFPPHFLLSNHVPAERLSASQSFSLVCNLSGKPYQSGFNKQIARSRMQTLILR